MTAAEFKQIVGREPEQDDLERANCNSAGTPGHYGCGVCPHGIPRFLLATCDECWSAKERAMRRD
jgi:hypothetical protein